MGKKRTGGIIGFFKNVGLLLRCLFTAVSFAALWIGIALYSLPYGVILIIIGALATLLCIFANVVVPLLKLKNNRR